MQRLDFVLQLPPDGATTSARQSRSRPLVQRTFVPLEAGPDLPTPVLRLIFGERKSTVHLTRHTESVEVFMKDVRRRRWSFAEKAALVRRAYEPGMSASLVLLREGVSAGLLFQWRKLERQGALTAVSAGEAVAPASELAAARAEIAKRQRVLGKKTLENESLKEAVE